MTLVSPTTSKSWKTTEDRSENYFQVRKNSFTTSAPGKQHSGGQCQSLKSSNTFVNRNTAILQQGKKTLFTLNYKKPRLDVARKHLKEFALFWKTIFLRLIKWETLCKNGCKS